MNGYSIMDRRNFMKFFSVLAASFVFPHCADSKEVDRILENLDKPGFYIRFIKPMKPIDVPSWKLKVGGLCENPLSLTLDELKKLEKATQVSRLTCVEGWSAKAKWGGFTAETFFAKMKPKSSARYLSFTCADGYYESIPLDILLKPRVLFVYEMNDGPLPDDHGGPLRIIIPSKYAYKSIKSILTVDFVERHRPGFWVENGYSDDATIKQGADFALDLKTYKLIKEPGEPDY